MDIIRTGALKIQYVQTVAKQQVSEKHCKKEPKCINCGQNHNANSKDCQIWHKEKEILRLKFTRNISFAEARKIVEAPTPTPGVSYASITQPSVKKVSVVDAVTQTEPIPGLETLEQLKTKNKIETQQNLNTEQTVTENSQTAPPSNETQKQEKILKNATIEMIKKDLKKQTQAKLKSQ